jgi:glycosyltransferase involved in cell wall biosynthesis
MSFAFPQNLADGRRDISAIDRENTVKLSALNVLEMLPTVLSENTTNKTEGLMDPSQAALAEDCQDSSTEPLRSVHITNYYHEHSGGVKANYDKLLLAADRHRQHISLIVPGEEPRVETVGKYGKIYFVAARRAPFFDRRYRVILPNQYLFKDSAVRKILLEEKPDFIEVYDNYSLVFLAGMTRMGYFKRLGRPMFVYFTGERFDTIFKTFVIGGRIGGWFSRRTLANFNLPMFDYYIANSSFVAEEILLSHRSANNPRRWEWFHALCTRFFKALPDPIDERLAICPRGVNTSQFSRDLKTNEARTKICRTVGVPVTSKLVVSATRLSPEKNVRLLPQIMERLSSDRSHDFRLLIAGSGTEKEWLTEQAQRFNGKMILVGQLDKASLAELYANTDVFIHPNPREPFGNVGLEAMASGSACVFPNAGGILTYADHSNSWLVDPDPSSFYNAIKEAVENEPLRQSKIKRAIDTAVHNSEDAAIDRLIATYTRFYRSFARRKFVESRPAQDAALHGNELHRRA